MSRALWQSLFVFDTRAVSEVDAEMREEFASHIALIEDELRACGMSADEAELGARRRFGDVQRLSRAGRNIKLGERIMLQRINFGLLLVLAAVVVWMAVRGNALQRESLAALQQVSARLDGFAGQHAPQPDSESPSAVRGAFIEGQVKNPGTYFVQPGMTVRKFIVSAGGLDQATGPMSVTITRKGVDGRTQKLEVPHESFTWPEGSDIEVQPDDIVTVRAQPLGMVYITGLVSRPGPYQLPRSGLTLRRLLVSAGEVKPGARSVTIEHRDGRPTERVSMLDLEQPGGVDASISGDDVVTVGDQLVDRVAGAAKPVGTLPDGWRRFEPAAVVTTEAKKNALLARYVEERTELDKVAEKLHSQGYPFEHREFQLQWQKALALEAQIEARVGEWQGSR